MRIEPIDKPSSWLGRLMSFAMHRQLGKQITPSRVVYNRVPRMWNVSWALFRLEYQGFRISHELTLLIQTRAAMLNRCEFCQDIAKAMAIQQKIGLEKFRDLEQYATSPAFDDREKAALAYVEEATRHKEVSDATFENLRKHFGEREICEITLANAIENFYNLINIPLEIPSDDLQALAEARMA